MNQPTSERLAVVWTKAQPTVAAYISSVIPDFHQAEDVLHKVAVVLVRKFEQYDPQRPFVGWALGIARLEVLKHRRQHATDRHVFAEDLVARIEAAYGQVSDHLEDRRRALRDCLAEVEGRSREALRLRYVDQLRPAAVATRMDLQPGAVRTLLSRVRTALRACIERRMNSWEGSP